MKTRKQIFAQNFNENVRDGDSIRTRVGAFEVVATIHRDDDTPSPDKHWQGFWPTLNPKAAGYIGDGKTQSDLSREQERQEEVMRLWKRGAWFWCGVAVTVFKNGKQITGDYDHALWGVDCNYPLDLFDKRKRRNTYLRDVANENAREALHAIEKES